MADDALVMQLRQEPGEHAIVLEDEHVPKTRTAVGYVATGRHRETLEACSDYPAHHQVPAVSARA
jgi:hypothetical protein